MDNTLNMFTLQQLSIKYPNIKIVGNLFITINRLVELKNYTNNVNDLTWCKDKNIDKLKAIPSGTIICSPLALNDCTNKNINYIITDKPRILFQDILTHYFYSPPVLGSISKHAAIHQNVKIGENVSIGNYTTIEEGCEIGNNVYIGNNNVILKGTIIKNHVFIGNNNTIGGIGFGYEKDEEGNFKLIPHIGNVVIHNQVEIGNNTCIDRAVLGSTIINQNCKIDNLVHISHNVEIGSNSVIIANALIGGSTIIGKNVWVAPSSSIINGVSVNNNSVIGLGAVVIKSVEENAVVVGNPAKNIKK